MTTKAIDRPNMRTNFIGAATRFLRASATNQIARFAPGYYVKLTKQTGRGEGDAETSGDISEYFLRCFEDYFHVIGVPSDAVGQWLHGKVLLEYGPGDLPGVAILMIAHGAGKVYCVDRFPMLALSEKNVVAIECLLNRMAPPERRRAGECFREHGQPRSGFAARRIEYLIRDNGLSGLGNQIDFVLSRAVLEHVNDLEGTFADMERALRPAAIAVHQVDLKSHGLHRDSPLDFLSWPAWMWNCMYSNKGTPNRWRVDRYRQVLAGTRLRVISLQPTLRADPHDISSVRPHLARPFRGLSDEDLSWLGFWLVCEKPVT
jgi:SAM-dependent methyltransferase